MPFRESSDCSLEEQVIKSSIHIAGLAEEFCRDNHVLCYRMLDTELYQIIEDLQRGHLGERKCEDSEKEKMCLAYAMKIGLEQTFAKAILFIPSLVGQRTLVPFQLESLFEDRWREFVPPFLVPWNLEKLGTNNEEAKKIVSGPWHTF
ncbi:MAG: hypothetical protein V1659_02610 [Candidatus Woesearchaeota archaeon]